MCFSATGSFIAGGVLSVAGGVTTRQAKKKTELPFASIPLLFGIQQITEGLVWLSFGMGSPALHNFVTYAYVLFSHILWPTFVPTAVLLLEKNPTRKKILRIFTGVGALLSLAIAYSIVVNPITSHIVNHSIAYDQVTAWYPYQAIALYFIVTCGSCLLSSHTTVKIFGTASFASALIAVWFFYQTFFSVWCFFGAILSALVYWHFKKQSRRGK